jgi:hypothetical protein
MAQRHSWSHRESRQELAEGDERVVLKEIFFRRRIMKAIAVLPGKSNSIHLAELPKPSLTDVPNGRGVLVKVLKVGVDGKDK